MAQIWTIFSRDIHRLARTPKTWIILVGMLIMPALYSWVNISAFWDPYSATEHIAVAVVNQDRGATTPETGQVNVGDQVSQKLADNHQIGWTFMDADQAEDALKRGNVYASITIPQNFSQDLLSIFTPDFHKPTLEYRVNTKRNAIAPIITDTAANELSNQITAAFKEQVATTVSATLKDGTTGAEDKLNQAQSNITSAFTKTADDIAQARTKLSNLTRSLDAAKSSTETADRTITQIEGALSGAQTALAQVQELTDVAQRSVTTYTDLTTSAFVEATTSAADAAAKARVTVADVTGVLGTSGEHLSTAKEQIAGALKDTGDALTTAQRILDSGALSADISENLRGRLDALQAAHQRNQTLLNDLSDLHASAKETLTTVTRLAGDIDSASEQTSRSAQTLRSTVSAAVPQLNASLGNLHYAAGAFSAALGGQSSTISEARTLLEGIRTQLSATQSVLSSFDADLAAVATGVDSIQHDLHSVNAASRSDILTTLTHLDAKNIGHVFASPVQVDTVPLFPIGTYGNAMAALFTNLSLWIGAFVLVVIFRLEVDLEGLPALTATQAYVGRLALFVPIVIAQALTVSIGNLLLGVQAAHPLGYVVSSVAIGVAYLSIIYALASAFGHIGRGIAILIVIVQIPGATGIYPIEMMPGFFRALSPLLPFSYGIDAIRETIGGFYGSHYAYDMAVLTLMGVAAIIAGVALRRSFAYAHTLVNHELLNTGLIASEPVHIPGTGYRVADVLRGLHGQDLTFTLRSRSRRYSQWMRWVALTGALGLLALSIAAALTSEQKVLVLGLWIAWIVCVFLAIAAIEYVRQSLHQTEQTAAEEPVK